MNEEEKKALAFLRFYVSDDEDEYFDKDYYIDKNIIETILNLIEKQQKEIEQTKTKINKIVLMIKENYNSDWYDDYETIAGLRDDIYNLLTKNIGE